MGTGCLIALEHPDGTITYVYCHFDGHMAVTGKILYQHYTSRPQVEALIEKGSMTALKLPSENMRRYDPLQLLTCPNEAGLIQVFQEQYIAYYYYLFTKEEYWVCRSKSSFSLNDVFE